jgi:hypothetical protein
VLTAVGARRLIPVVSWTTRLPAAPRCPRQVVHRARIHPRTAVAVHAAADSASAVVAILPPTIVGEMPTWVPMVAASPGWALVLLPCRPDGVAGWIALDESVVLVPQSTAVELDIATSTLRVRDRGTDSSWRVGVGRPATPTPLGWTFVLGEVWPAAGSVRRALLLSAHRPTHLMYSTGLDALGVHTWSSDLDPPGTDGSILAHPEAMGALLAFAPAGTAVRVIDSSTAEANARWWAE